MVLQVLKEAQQMVFNANCIFAGFCAPQVFVYTPGMYSSVNQDFVRGTVTSFYEMFKQVTIRKSQYNTDEDTFRAFVFGNKSMDGSDDVEDRVCPMDDMEWELKVRNEAMKRGCASTQLDSVKSSLYIVRTIVDVVVETLYYVLQIFICLFRFMVPSTSETSYGEIIAEIDYWMTKLITKMIDSLKHLANLLFNLIFSTGPLGSVMKLSLIHI